MGNYMGRSAQGPTKDVYNIPSEIVQEAIDITVSYGECPHCGYEQFYTVVPGHNSEHECVNCKEKVKVVG